MENPMPCQCGGVDLAESGPRIVAGTMHMFSDGGKGKCYQGVSAIPPVPTRQGLEYTTFVRIPFTVEAVWITKENIAEVAKYIGDLEFRDDGMPYILVDPRKVPSVDKVYPGYAMTRMGENVRCYSRRVFLEQFTEQTEAIRPWFEFMQTVNDGR